MSVVFAGTLGAFVQSRRMTEGSVFQNSATTVIQGYLEQIKNMDFWEIPYYDGGTLYRGSVTTADATIYTQLDSVTMDTLQISSCAPILPANVTPGVVPTTAGLVDNYKVIDINDTPDTTQDDLRMHLWVWVSSLDNTAGGVGPSRCIRIVYTWSFNNGGISRANVDSITTVRSVVPTF
ncbi:hypothetical protein [Actomonas aquatica]|uniref:Type 4 secretion system PilS N-terminal domain-containing protein n=1 Tax=Actomonas aquatica TaxID=2866162 RepID=A0ABZ1CAD0_9BACT|nr:hypothetical protein [Opitutus sp. WL0086]WRQ88178.1 hypothetical protein K1X11_002080 [Opitutus sp. WL0086]